MEIRYNYFACRVFIFWIIFVWCICIKYWNNVTAMFCFRFSLSHTFITSQLRYLFVEKGAFLWRHNYVQLWKSFDLVNCVWKLHYEMVIFYFVITFLAYQLFDNADILHYIKIILRHHIKILNMFIVVYLNQIWK